MNTPRTDAIDTYQPFVVSSDKYRELANLSRQLETQVQELREALEKIYMRTIDIDSRATAKAILERK